MNYGNILTTTWKTIWKEKTILWFGMLMVIIPVLAGLVIGGAIIFISVEQIERFFESDFSNVATLIFFILYFLFLASSIFLAALSYAGTMKGTLMASQGSEELDFSALWEASLPYFWRMLGVMFSVGFAFMLIAIIPFIFLGFVGALTAGIGFLCVFPFMLLFIPLGIVAYLMLSLSMAALIAEDETVFESIQRAWGVLKAKFWSLVLMAVILYFIQMAIGMIIAIPMNAIQFAFIFPMQTAEQDPEIFLRLFGILMAFFIPLSSIMQSLGLTYVNGAWLLSYLEASQAPTTHETENEIIYDA